VLGHFRNRGYRTGVIGKVHLPEGWIEGDCDVLLDYPEYGKYLEERGLSGVRDDIWYPEQDPAIGQSWDGRKSALDYRDSVEGWVSRETASFMRESVNEGKPFLIEASMPRPHQIYAPSEPFWSLYEGELRLPPNADADLSQKAPHLRALVEQNRTGEWTQFEPRTFEAGRLRKLRGYLGCVSQVDHAVGEMLAVLDELGIADNTIVI
jgi:arylsulfatase A-like enzyme